MFFSFTDVNLKNTSRSELHFENLLWQVVLKTELPSAGTRIRNQVQVKHRTVPVRRPLHVEKVTPNLVLNGESDCQGLSQRRVGRTRSLDLRWGHRRSSRTFTSVVKGPTRDPTFGSLDGRINSSGRPGKHVRPTVETGPCLLTSGTSSGQCTDLALLIGLHICLSTSYVRFTIFICGTEVISLYVSNVYVVFLRLNQWIPKDLSGVKKKIFVVENYTWKILFSFVTIYQIRN